MLINITPGSVTIELSDDRRTLYVHVMHITSAEAADARSRKDSNVASSCCSSSSDVRLTVGGYMLEMVTQFALMALGVALLLAVVRLVRGPTLPDRIVAMDLVGVLVIGLIVVLAASTDVRATLDAAIVIALVGFLGTVAYATYVERGHPE